MAEWWGKRSQGQKVTLIVSGLVLLVAAWGLTLPDEKNWKQRYNDEAPAEKPKNNYERADSYAYSLAGSRFGCSLKKPRPAGCRYAAALTACLDALDGKKFETEGPTGYPQQFPEPEYYAVAEKAYADCSKPDGWKPD